MSDIQNIEQNHEVISSRAQKIFKKCEKKETLMKIAEKPGSFSECRSVSKRSQERVVSPLYESEHSSNTLTSVKPDPIRQPPKPVSATSSETKVKTKTKSFESSDITNQKKSKLSDLVQNLPIQNAVVKIDIMTPLCVYS